MKGGQPFRGNRNIVLVIRDFLNTPPPLGNDVSPPKNLKKYEFNADTAHDKVFPLGKRTVESNVDK